MCRYQYFHEKSKSQNCGLMRGEFPFWEFPRLSTFFKKTKISDALNFSYKIAAHAADIAKGHPGAIIRDNALSKARFEFRWRDQFHLSLDPERALEYFEEGHHTDGEYCTMCGPNFCALKLTHELKRL